MTFEQPAKDWSGGTDTQDPPDESEGRTGDTHADKARSRKKPHSTPDEETTARLTMRCFRQGEVDKR